MLFVNFSLSNPKLIENMNEKWLDDREFDKQNFIKKGVITFIFAPRAIFYKRLYLIAKPVFGSKQSLSMFQ